MQTAAYESKQSIMRRIITVFVFTLLVATIGLYTGQFIPPALIAAVDLRGRHDHRRILAALKKSRRICVCLFIRFHFRNDAVSDYQPLCVRAGAYVVLEAFGSSFVIFAVLGTIGAKTKKDLSFLWSFLLVAVIALLAVGIFNIFSPLNSAAMMAYSVIGTIVFSMYILYDLNQIKHRDITADLIPLMALTLYIDFINLFINLLRFFGILNSDD
ncbi:Bax inhibitor-1 family protein [Bacillus velezensis]|nr:Bax inhibitor-1 family protein [Bacillus velezensis]